MDELAWKRACMNTFSCLLSKLETMKVNELKVFKKYVSDFKPRGYEGEKHINEFKKLKNEMLNYVLREYYECSYPYVAVSQFIDKAKSNPIMRRVIKNLYNVSMGRPIDDPDYLDMFSNPFRKSNDMFGNIFKNTVNDNPFRKSNDMFSNIFKNTVNDNPVRKSNDVPIKKRNGKVKRNPTKGKVSYKTKYEELKSKYEDLKVKYMILFEKYNKIL